MDKYKNQIPLSEMGEEWYERLYEKAGKLENAGSTFGFNYHHMADDKFGIEEMGEFFGQVVSILENVMPDFRVLTFFEVPDKNIVGGFAIAPFAGVFLVISIDIDGFSVSSEVINEKEQNVLIKNTCKKNDHSITDFAYLARFSREFVKAKEKPELKFICAGPDADRGYFLTKKHIEKYHCLPVDV